MQGQRMGADLFGDKVKLIYNKKADEGYINKGRPIGYMYVDKLAAHTETGGPAVMFASGPGGTRQNFVRYGGAEYKTYNAGVFGFARDDDSTGQYWHPDMDG